MKRCNPFVSSRFMCVSADMRTFLTFNYVKTSTFNHGRGQFCPKLMRLSPCEILPPGGAQLCDHEATLAFILGPGRVSVWFCRDKTQTKCEANRQTRGLCPKSPPNHYIVHYIVHYIYYSPLYSALYII